MVSDNLFTVKDKLVSDNTIYLQLKFNQCLIILFHSVNIYIILTSNYLISSFYQSQLDERSQLLQTQISEQDDEWLEMLELREDCKRALASRDRAERDREELRERVSQGEYQTFFRSFQDISSLLCAVCLNKGIGELLFYILICYFTIAP